jgi:hypothetical protein
MPDVYQADGDYTLMYELAQAAYPRDEHPGALVHRAPGLRRDELCVVVYLHGWENCAENVVRPRPGNCPPSQEPDPSGDLIGQLDRSGKRALLLVPELRYHARTSDPGKLGQPGALQALLREVLGRLDGDLAGARVEEVRRVAVFSHSGGYQAAAALATQGGVPVEELYLLDSFYGAEEAIAGFVRDGIAGRRFVSLYTGDGGTAQRSRALAGQIGPWLAAAGQPASTLCFDDADGDPQPDQLGARLLIKRVRAAHSDIPFRHFGELLRTSGLPG